MKYKQIQNTKYFSFNIPNSTSKKEKKSTSESPYLLEITFKFLSSFTSTLEKFLSNWLWK